jgi:hypothetical protein
VPDARCSPHESQSLGPLVLRERDGAFSTGGAVFASCTCPFSLAKRSARSRAVLARIVSLSASYSRIASAASRARCSFIAVAATRCWTSFELVVIGFSQSIDGAPSIRIHVEDLG